MAFGGFGGSGFGGNTQGGPFGQSQPPAFGQQQTTPFGGGGFGQQNQPSTTPFGGGQSAFGAPASGGGFGATQTGGFGQPSTSTPFGGGSAFGAKPATPSFGGFGSSAPATSSFGSTPAAGGFGAPASTGFGQQPQTTPFGSTGGGFGSTTSTTPFGGGSSAFGQPQTQSAFGSASTSSAFGGGTAFGGGATGSAFGQPAGGMQAGRGTGGAAWRKTQEIDQSSTGARSTVYFNSITCMPEYVSKSVEELRWEDYEAGNKGGQQAGVGLAGGVGGQTGGMFGSQNASSTPFGGTTQSPPSNAFGAPAQTTSAFGAPAQTTFGGSSAFGASSTPAFGTSSTPAFGASGATPAPAFGGGSAFGGSSTPAFGAPASTPAFGAPASTPAFGASSAPAFGAPGSTSTFGGTAAASAPAFGGGSAFGAPSSTPAFGAASSAPAFGTTGSTPAFGGGSAFGSTSSTPAFGASSTPAFGTSAPAPAATPSFSFGGAAVTPKPASFQFNSPAPTTTTFGATPGIGGMSTPAFGAGSSTPAFGSGGLFGSTPAPAAGQPPAQTFGGGALGTPGLFGNTPAATGAAQQASAGLGAASPYGNMPAAPKVTPLPEYKVGLTQRILAPPSAGPPKAIALITPRSLTPHGGGKIRPRVSATATRMSKSPADFFASSTLQGTPGTKSTTPGGTGTLFVPRDDPRRLLIRDDLPLPSSAKKSTPNSGRTHMSPSTLAHQSGRDNGTPQSTKINGTYPRAEGLHTNGLTSSPSPLTLKSLSPPNSAKDNLAVLPILKREGYSIEPSMKQLGAMALDDPLSLSYVANFTVKKEGVGSVRWLDPVDIRNLDLDSIVTLAKGAIDVYPDDSVKPPVGHGLNRPAVVTMINVFKLDKATGQPTKDPELVEKFSRKLKATCARQSARFMSYDGETGEWKFETDHFSRYGLDGSSDDEDDESQEAPPEKVASELTAAAMQDDSAKSDFSDLSDDSDEMCLGIKGRHIRRETNATLDEDVPAHRPSADTLGSLRNGNASLPTGFGASIVTPSLSPIGLHRQLDVGFDPIELDKLEEDDDFVPIFNWKSIDSAPRGVLASASATTKDQRMTGQDVHITSQARHTAVNTKNIVDYGALMHNAFGAELSRGRIIVPQMSPRGRVVLQSMGRDPDAESSDSERQLLLDQLIIHNSNSFRVEGTPAGRSPRQQLKCGRSPELLRQLTMQYIDSIGRYVERQDEESDETLSKLSQAEVWELVNVLFSLVPAEEDPVADDTSDTSDQGNLMSLAAMQRRAKFSEWLKSCASDSVKRQLEAISGLPGKENEEVLMRLSGHDLRGAVKRASAAGNVRLSTLLATAGSSTEAVNNVMEQIRIWKEEGYTDHIDEQMAEIYEVLAGNVAPAMYVVANDWKRSLGMHLWYARPNTDPISEAVESYLVAVQSGTAPYPAPWHPIKATPDARRPTDTAFELIRMFCFSEDWDSGDEKAAASLDALADFLCPLGTTPDVLRADFYWHMLCVLEAIGVIPEVSVDDVNLASYKPEVVDAVSSVITSFIAQLESMGGMVHWAIYVALHIRDDDYRDLIVSDLLSRYVEEWHTNDEVVEFLVQVLGIPVAMLEEAKSTWAMYIKDDEMLLDALIESNAWNRAHDVFRQKVAPVWFLAQSPTGNPGVLHESLIGALEEFESHVDLIDAEKWRVGGEMYLSYFRLQEKLEHVELDDLDRASLDELAQALDDASMSCCRGDADDLETAAYAYLAREIARMGGTPDKLSSGTNALRCAAVASKISTISSALLAEQSHSDV